LKKTLWIGDTYYLITESAIAFTVLKRKIATEVKHYYLALALIASLD
jgi:hypothetical protein